MALAKLTERYGSSAGIPKKLFASDLGDRRPELQEYPKVLVARLCQLYSHGGHQVTRDAYVKWAKAGGGNGSWFEKYRTKDPIALDPDELFTDLWMYHRDGQGDPLLGLTR